MDRYVTHATFSLERSYPVPPARVFTAWADPAAKARWFTPGPGSGHQLDFRVGGREVATGGPDGGPAMTFETLPGHRPGAADCLHLHPVGRR
jgi:uncharacterized protein YndB with AHSA1/START domain